MRLIGFLFVLSLLCASCGAREVNPRVYEAIASVEPAEYVGSCPVAIKTRVNITGSPGLTVTYRFIGDGFSWGPLRHAIIPASGQLQVFETASIDAVHAGFFFRQVWIILKGYRLDKYSNRALYTVTCGVRKQVSWRVETPMYHGPCPKTINFTGSISAEPGTRLQYRTIGDGAAWGPVRGAVVGRSQPLLVAESLVVDAAHAGYFYRQLWVIGQRREADVYSKRTLYFVACVPGSQVTFTYFDIAAPTEFTATNDPKLCGDHVEPLRAGILCGLALASGQLVLVWNWKPDGCPSGRCRPRIDGYRVYQTFAKKHLLILTQTDPALTIASLKEETSALSGNCYTVRAFVGNNESRDSNELCVAPGYGERLRRALR